MSTEDPAEVINNVQQLTLISPYAEMLFNLLDEMIFNNFLIPWVRFDNAMYIDRMLAICECILGGLSISCFPYEVKTLLRLNSLLFKRGYNIGLYVIIAFKNSISPYDEYYDECQSVLCEYESPEFSVELYNITYLGAEAFMFCESLHRCLTRTRPLSQEFCEMIDEFQIISIRHDLAEVFSYYLQQNSLKLTDIQCYPRVSTPYLTIFNNHLMASEPDCQIGKHATYGFKSSHARPDIYDLNICANNTTVYRQETRSRYIYYDDEYSYDLDDFDDDDEFAEGFHNIRRYARDSDSIE